MPHHPTKTVSGTVRDVFAHRFVLTTSEGDILADLGPRGAEVLRLARGDAISITGEAKPSELKISRLERDGTAFDIPHGEDKHPEGDPEVAKRAAIAAGLAPLGEPRAKPKHFELLARDRAGQLVELHVRFDGDVHKRKEVDGSEEKWAGLLASAR